ncbi:transposase [Streptomyces sp. CA-252508]|uniref:transposase n=1 Tax=Streptomyces sp. CA-252508 TaxID=3418946 RepID=UPI003D8B3F3E
MEWEFLRPLLPEPLRGRKRLDDRAVLNGIVWKFRTGPAWRDVPERYGPWHTLRTRFRRWLQPPHAVASRPAATRPPSPTRQLSHSPHS